MLREVIEEQQRCLQRVTEGIYTQTTVTKCQAVEEDLRKGNRFRQERRRRV